MFVLQNPAPMAPVRIMAIDPGSETLGVSILDLYEHPNVSMVMMDSTTYKASARVDLKGYAANLHGSRALRIDFHRENLYRLMVQFQPDIVIAEAPFMGRFAQSFETLVEVRSGIKQALFAYDPNMPFEAIDPTTVKAFLGARTKGDTKEDVRQKLLALACLQWNRHIRPDLLDEHSIDSAAIAYWRAMQFLMNGV